MAITLDGSAGVTFPDAVQQTNAVTNTGGGPPFYAARAWANVNTSGTILIRAQANIAAAARVTTGRYSFTFLTPMPDANYIIISTAGSTSTGAQYADARITSTPTTSGFQLMVCGQSGGVPILYDPDFIHVVVFR